MKLDGEVAYYHSNIILEPESQSFEFDDDEIGSARCKLANQKVNKNDNQILTDLKRQNEGDINLPPFDKAGDEGFTESKLDSHKGNADLKSDNNATFPDPSQDIVCVKKSSDVSIPGPPRKRESFENLPAIYMDKGVTECEPELVVCYKESTYHLIKDICVDEGVPAKDNMLLEKSANENNVYKFLPSESYGNKELMKDNVGVNAPLPSLLDLLTSDGPQIVSSDHCQCNDFMQRDEDATEKPANTVCTEMVLPEDKVLSQELDTEESGQSVDNADKIEQNYSLVSGDSKFQSKPQESKNRIEKSVVASPVLAGAVDELNSDILLSDSMPEIGNVNSQFDPSAPTVRGKEESHQVGDCESDEIQIASEQADGKLNDQDIMNQVRHSLGESSFSVIGPVSGHLNYSGPVPYSGSISLRSDSSTTSTRSFAFPVLQTEWNSSPVRMAKADRKNYRKHRCWRHGLLCCKF